MVLDKADHVGSSKVWVQLQARPGMQVRKSLAVRIKDRSQPIQMEIKR